MTLDSTGPFGRRQEPQDFDIGGHRALGLVLGAWIAFGALHTLVRIVGDGQLASADGLSMMAAQSLRVAYQVGQPPLYDWTLWAVQQVTGPTAFSAYLTKYGFTTLAGVFIYLGTLAAGLSRLHGILASLSLMLLYNVGISIHDQSTHSVAMVAALAVTFHAFMMIAKRGAWPDYVELGLAMAFGILSKYGYVLMPAAFALAFAASPALRPRIVSPRFLAAVGIAALIVLPFVLWLVLHRHVFVWRTGAALLADGKASHLWRVMLGVAKLSGSLVIYAVPAMPVLWALWPQLLRRGTTLAAVRSGSLPDVAGLAIAIAIAVSVGLILVSGINVMRSRYMHVLGLLIPAYAVMHLRREELTRARLTAFMAIVLIVQAVPIVGRALATVFPTKPFCSSCSVVQPIGRLAEALTERGYAKATILLESENARLGGNLRRYLPGASIITARLPAIGSERASPDAPCIAIDELQTGEPEPAGGTLGRVATEVITVAWPPALAGPERQSRWVVRRLPRDDRRCAAPAR